MDADLFLQQFGHLAQGEGGIKKLRDLILQLAVRGKLVEQNPADEPAEVLLKKIEADKKRLIKDGVVRKQEAFANVSNDAKPFLIPFSWKFVFLGAIGDWGAGATPNRKESAYYGGSIPWFKSGELTGDIITDSEEYITEKALKECSLRLNKIGDIAIAMYGATIGKTAIIGIESTTNQAVCACTPYEGVFNRYLLLGLKAFVHIFTNQGAGGAQPNISRIKIINTPFPLPPLAEQKRIVAKVDELMALCDKLEAEQKTQRTLKTQAVQSTLHHLTSAESAASFGTSLNILERAFGDWFDDLATVKHLRATILQLAVQGKLVPQSPTDEPASELLKRIEAEKKRLVKERKIKATKPISPILADKQPFSLPHGWEWVRFEEIIDPRYAISYGVLVPGDDYPDGIPFVRLADLDLKNPPKLPEKSISPDIDQQYERTRLEGGEILMGVVGSIGKLGIAPDSWKGANIARAICRIVPSKELHKGFLIKLLASDFMQSNFKGDTRTLAQPTLNIGLIRSSCTPLPPLAEQKRIVTKVDELMTLCDQLEAHITHTQTLNTHLMDSLIHRMTEAA